MEKRHILVSGRSIAADQSLIRELGKSALVTANDDVMQIETIIKKQKINLILLELSRHGDEEMALIKRVKNSFATVEIILIDGDGDQELIAQAFAYGVKDAFRKPYQSSLIVERSRALLRFK